MKLAHRHRGTTLNAHLAKGRDALLGLLRGDAPLLSKAEISQTISFARITLIVGLVFLHYQEYPDLGESPFVGMDISQHPLATFVNSFILFFFFSVVPLLSMVSGWLFFSFDPQEAALSLRRRIRRRVSSLYLPLVFWNALFLLVLGVLFLSDPGYPLLAGINIHFPSATWMDYVNAVFGITRHPVGFQFWFVRDLFVTMLVSPLLWLSLKHTPYLGMAFLAVAWMIGSHLVIFFRTDVVFFFYLGGFLRTREIPLHVGRKAAYGLLITYVTLVALRTMAPMFIDLAHQRPHWLTGATRSMRLVGVLACWSVFLQIARTRFGTAVARYGGLAFFLHAIHYPLIAEVKILLWHLVPAQTDGWLIAHFFVSVAVTVTIGMWVGVQLARRAPRLFALMNGGRPGLFAEPRAAVPARAPVAAADATTSGAFKDAI